MNIEEIVDWIVRRGGKKSSEGKYELENLPGFAANDWELKVVCIGNETA